MTQYERIARLEMALTLRRQRRRQRVSTLIVVFGGAVLATVGLLLKS